MKVDAKGDLHMDDHHTVEDTGIALGQAICQGAWRSARHHALCRDRSRHGRDDDARRRRSYRAGPSSSGTSPSASPKIGTFDTELVREFLQALAQNAGMTLHMLNHYGANNHHIAETCFKAVARALRTATEIDPRQAGRVPSTKGTLALSPIMGKGRWQAIVILDAPPEDRDRSQIKTRFIRDGFSWPAFLFPTLWMLCHRLWLAGGRRPSAAGGIALGLMRQAGSWFAAGMSLLFVCCVPSSRAGGSGLARSAGTSLRGGWLAGGAGFTPTVWRTAEEIHFSGIARRRWKRISVRMIRLFLRSPDDMGGEAAAFGRSGARPSQL